MDFLCSSLQDQLRSLNESLSAAQLAKAAAERDGLAQEWREAKVRECRHARTASNRVFAWQLTVLFLRQAAGAMHARPQEPRVSTSMHFMFATTRLRL
jgi:hypothetical protein